MAQVTQIAVQFPSFALTAGCRAGGLRLAHRRLGPEHSEHECSYRRKAARCAAFFLRAVAVRSRIFSAAPASDALRCRNRPSTCASVTIASLGPIMFTRVTVAVGSSDNETDKGSH